MRLWQWANLAPYWANVGSLTTIEANALIKYAATHSIALYIVVILVSESVFLFQLLFGEV